MTSVSEPQPVLPPPTLMSRAQGLLRRRATWVLIDQAMVSGGNFLTSGLLARHLAQADYGIFNVLLETLNYLNSLQAALIIYPLTIKGATGERADLGRLTTGSILLTIALLPILGGATVFSVGALGGGGIAVAAVAALLLWQIQETLRRALMADLRFADAVWGDGIRYLGQVGLMFVLNQLGILSLNAAFLIMGLTSAVAIALQAWQLGIKPLRPWQLRLMTRDFWKLGRWVLLTNAGGAVSALGFWWTLQWKHGAAATAVFGAIVLPFRLANPIMNSMTGLIVPSVARAQATEGPRAARRAALRYIALGAVLLLPFFVVLALFPYWMLSIFYKPDSPYVSYGQELRLFVMNYVVVYILFASGAWLAGLGRSRWNFYSQLVNMAATVAIGLPFTAKWGVWGLIIGGLISAGLGTVVSLYYIFRASQLESQPGAHSPGNL